MQEPNPFVLKVSTLIAPDTLRMIGVAHWGVVDRQEEAYSSGIFKAAGLGMLLGPAAGGALLMRSILDSNQVRFKGVLGIVCVTEDSVSLLEIGEIPLIGTDKTNVSVPKEVIEAISNLRSIKRQSKYHPLDVWVEGRKLVVRSVEQREI